MAKSEVELEKEHQSRLFKARRAIAATEGWLDHFAERLRRGVSIDEQARIDALLTATKNDLHHEVIGRAHSANDHESRVYAEEVCPERPQ